MIFDILLSMFSVLISFFAMLLPNWGIPADVLEGVRYFFQYAFVIDGILPVTTIFICVSTILVFESFILISKLIGGIISIIRGGGDLEI